jgi:hypothetical protein
MKFDSLDQYIMDFYCYVYFAPKMADEFKVGEIFNIDFFKVLFYFVLFFILYLGIDLDPLT